MPEVTGSANPERPIAAQLREIGIFGGMGGPTLERLCAALPVVHAQTGDRIVDEGESARAMYVVLSGEVEILKRSAEGTDVRVALLGAGDWFGEMSLLDIQPRSASAMCVARTSLLRITSQHVDELLYRADLKAYTLLMMNIARELSRRLRVADGILVNLQMTLSTEFSRGSGAR